MAFLFDTNVLSELRKGERCNLSVRQWFSTIEAEDLYTSVLVVGEIRRGIELLRRRDRRGATALDRWLTELEHRYQDRILPITIEICRIWGGMSLERPLAPIDGLIAATAVHHGMTLVTRNVADVDAAHAGIADSPLPVLQAGAKTYHLYSVPGVISAGSLGTYFSCTSTSLSAQQAAVEVFDQNGSSMNNPVTTQLTLAPGEAKSFGTSGAAAILLDVNLNLPTATRASARIISTSKSVLCTAYISDTGSSPPASMVHLTVVKKTKQAGE